MRDVFSFDLETVRFSDGNMAPKPVVLSHGGALTHHTEIKKVVGEALDAGRTAAGHGIHYDFACLLAHEPDLAPAIWKAYAENRVECTEIREKLLDISIGRMRKGVGSYTLQRCSPNELDKGADGWRLRYGELLNVPLCDWPERATAYAIDDGTEAEELHERQERRAASYGYDMPTQHDEVRAALGLQLAGVWGILTDVEYVERQIKSNYAAMKEHAITAQRYKVARIQQDLFGGLGEIKVDKKHQRRLIAASWPADMGPVPETGTGLIKTNKETILLCDHPALEATREFEHLRKLDSTYWQKMRRGRVHPGYNAVGAESDRTSSFQPNITNQPRGGGVREGFISRPGKVFVVGDFNSQEMRTLGQSCLDLLGWSTMAQRFINDPDWDAHQWLADELDMPRQDTKIMHFGLGGGMGPKGLVRYAKGFGATWSLDQATQNKQFYLKSYPEMPQFFKFVQSLTGGFGQFGKITHPRTGFERDNVSFTEGSNHYFQHLAACCTKRALWEVVRRCYTVTSSWLYGSRPTWMVHDEIAVECDERWAHECALELKEVMENAQETLTPDVPCRVEVALSRRWSKGAKPVYEGGRLVPFEVTV